MRVQPAGWGEAALGHLVADPGKITDGPFGSNLKTSHYTESGPGVIRLQNVGADGSFVGDPAHIAEAHYAQLRKHAVEAGDVVIASLGDVLPRACLVPAHIPPAIVKADCIRIRVACDVDPRYVAWWLNSPAARRTAEDLVHGVGRPRLGLRTIRELRIPVAPAAEQQRIVAAIEEHFSRLDAAEASLRRALRTLGALRNRALEMAFSGDWRFTPTAAVAEVQGGIQKQPSRRPLRNKAPFLRVANVLRGGLDLRDVHEIELIGTELARYELRPGDLLVVEGNGSIDQIGRSAMWHGAIEGCVHQNHLIRVRPGPTLQPAFLEAYWNAPSTRKRLAAIASSTSGLYTLSVAKVKAVPIPVVARDDQDTIAREFERRASIIGAMASQTDAALRRAAALRGAILDRAFAGELVLQDRSDEPASVLLDRIATERPTRKTPRRQRTRT